MSSLDVGKAEAVEWVKANFKQGDTCLDVGTCDGKWFNLLGDYLAMDGVEIYAKYVYKHDLISKYRSIFIADIRRFAYDRYDLIIFGDVLEHMTVTEARRVIDYAYERCTDMLIAVPYEWEQGPIRHNEHERHIQDDLTHELFMERYPGLVPIFRTEQYGYYVKGESR